MGRAASLIARAWKYYVWLRYGLEQDGPLGAEGEAPETLDNLEESGVDPLQQPPPFRFLERSADSEDREPMIAAVWRDAPAKLLQYAWESRQLYVKRSYDTRHVPRLRSARRHALRDHRSCVARCVAWFRDVHNEIMCHGRVLVELSGLLSELDELAEPYT